MEPVKTQDKQFHLNFSNRYVDTIAAVGKMKVVPYVTFYSFLHFISVYCTCMIRHSNAVDIFGDDCWEVSKSWESQETIMPFCWHGNFYVSRRLLAIRENQKAFLKKFYRLIYFCHNINWKVDWLAGWHSSFRKSKFFMWSEFLTGHLLFRYAYVS